MVRFLVTIMACGAARPPANQSIRRENVNICLTKLLASGLTAMFVFATAATASDGAGKDDAIAMVKKAVSFIKEQGAEKAYPEFTGKAANFIDRDLYVVVYQLDGKVLA